MRRGHAGVLGCLKKETLVSLSLRDCAKKAKKNKKKNNLKISCLALEHVNAVLIRFKEMESGKKKNQ